MRLAKKEKQALQIFYKLIFSALADMNHHETKTAAE